MNADLQARLAELVDIGHAGGLAGWDQQVNMPPAAAEARGEMMATLERLHHERLTDPALAELLGADSSDVARAVLRDVDRARRVPGELVAERARASAAAQTAWLAAREADDFAIFAPALERHVELNRRLAACFEVEHPYDALLDRFEPGMTTADVSAVFGRLREGLVPLVDEIVALPAPDDLPGPFGIAEQQQLGLELAKAIGFDEANWRIDESVHPFSSSFGSTDIRVTSRYDSSTLTGLFAVMHEVGHGLYERQVDPALARTGAGTGVSLGIHESQSRLWENLVGRSRPFWEHWHPRAIELFGADALGGTDLDAFLRSINAVKRSFTRVEADEATYALHVILRFELEVALIEGSLEVSGVEEAWNAKTKELLGLDVPGPAVGVLQDIHWAFGEMGYFPTYAIGNMVASQLWLAIERDLPSLRDEIASGELGSLREWLRENVHRHGAVLMPAEVLERATGQRLDPQPMLDHLRAKFLG